MDIVPPLLVLDRVIIVLYHVIIVLINYDWGIWWKAEPVYLGHEA